MELVLPLIPIRTTHQARAAERAGRAARRVCADPDVPIDTLAHAEHVSRRQLERDFERWIGTSPHHLAQRVRVESVSRLVRSGASLATIAADAGFADQAHMSRVVRQWTGLTPAHLARSPQTPAAPAPRQDFITV